MAQVPSPSPAMEGGAAEGAAAVGSARAQRRRADGGLPGACGSPYHGFRA